MKSTIALLFLLAAQPIFSMSASADPVVRDVGVAVNDVFIPEKVEHGAEAKIILNGMFPNSCYRGARAETKDTSPTTHFIQVRATVTQTMCLMVLVPWTKEVNLGRLPAGAHTLRFVNGDETYFERTLTVE